MTGRRRSLDRNTRSAESVGSRENVMTSWQNGKLVGWIDERGVLTLDGVSEAVLRTQNLERIREQTDVRR